MALGSSISNFYCNNCRSMGLEGPRTAVSFVVALCKALGPCKGLGPILLKLNLSLAFTAANTTGNYWGQGPWKGLGPQLLVLQ